MDLWNIEIQNCFAQKINHVIRKLENLLWKNKVRLILRCWVIEPEVLAEPSLPRWA